MTPWLKWLNYFPSSNQPLMMHWRNSFCPFFSSKASHQTTSRRLRDPFSPQQLTQYGEKCSHATGNSEANVKWCRITVETSAQKHSKIQRHGGDVRQEWAGTEHSALQRQSGQRWSTEPKTDMETGQSLQPSAKQNETPSQIKANQTESSKKNWKSSTDFSEFSFYPSVWLWQSWKVQFVLCRADVRLLY